MKIEVSNGEIVDKITILQIKLEKIQDSVKRENIEKELSVLSPELEKGSISIDQRLIDELHGVNLQLWDIEDKIREKEHQKVFDDEFIELARSVYRTNDERSRIKKDINVLTRSNLVEEKSYKKY